MFFSILVTIKQIHVIDLNVIDQMTEVKHIVTCYLLPKERSSHKFLYHLYNDITTDTFVCLCLLTPPCKRVSLS